MNEDGVAGQGLEAVPVEELRRRARVGDMSALQALRDRGFFTAKAEAAGFPVSPPQQRLWLVNQMVPDPAVYNLPHAFVLDGRLDVETLRRALSALVSRHESLRTTFGQVGKELRQFVHDNREPMFEVVDLAAVADGEAVAREAISRDARTAFDLSAGPLMRTTLFRLSDERHVLSVNLHHIICDGWSLEVLGRDLGALYAGTPLEPLSLQHKDYAAQESRRQDLDASRAYWHRKLAGELTPLMLAERPRPAVQTSAGATVLFDIDARWADALEAVGRSQHATSFMSIVALVKVLLFRHTGQQDLIVGTPIANRDRPDLQHQIGMFANTLALRDVVNSQDTFADVVRSVRRTSLEAYEHQQYPFDRLVSELGLERDVSRPPLFNVMLSFEHSGTDALALGDVRVTSLETVDCLAKFDLTFFFTRSAHGLGVRCDYNRDLFTPSRIDAMAGHLQHLARHVSERPDAPIGRLPMMASEELASLLSFSGRRSEYGRGISIHERFEEQVRANPDRVAVLCGDRVLTYAELNAASDRLARHLRADCSVAPEECIGVLLERSEWVAIAWLAILKAGCAYVPLSLTDPDGRLQHILQDTRARVVISEGEHLTRMCSGLPGLHTIDVREPLHSSGDTSACPAGQPAIRGNLAYVIYTSGSTGQPKGVLVEHDAVTRLVRHTDYVTLDETDRILVTGSLAFDASTFEIWGALLNGGTVCFAPGTSILDSVELAALIGRHRVTTMWLTSSLFNEVADRDALLFGGLRQLLIGGEKLSPRHVTLVREACPELRLVNGYGPTENTTFTACYQIQDRFETDIPIGRPIINTTVFILDANGEMAPAGVPGEIYAGGDGLARGYVADAALTASRFVPHPFGNGERLYRTGDLGRWRPDGNIEYLGRADAQIKIRGHRIEPGEIEHALLRHAAVRQCAVVARESGNDRQLVAYVVADEPGCDAVSLRDHLRAALPGYMIPAHFVVLDKLPLGRTGKVDHSRLPAPDKRVAGASLGLCPWTIVESQLAPIWREVLDIDALGPDDNFFELGGHSLKAVQLVARIHACLQVRIGLIDVFRAPTIASLATIVAEAHPFGAAPIPAVAESADYPVSHAQRRLWVLDRMGALTAAYNIAGAFEIRGDLNVPALSLAVNALVERHDSLRTTFVEEGGEPRQVIHQFDRSRRWLQVEERRGETFETTGETTGTRFDLERGPLFKSTLVRYGGRDVLHLEMHHVISDGWSIEVMLRELLQLYVTLCKGADNPLQPLRIQYKDYAAWQNNYLRSPKVEEHRDHWHRALEGALPALDLPADRVRPPTQTFRGDVVSFPWPAASLARLTAIGRRHGASEFMTVVALVKVLLHRYTRQSDIIVGSPVALRDHPDLEHQVGFFVNMLPLRDRISGRDSFAGVLGKVRGTVMRALEHRVYPFDRLVEELEITRDMGRNPVFDCVVTYQNATKATANLHGLDVAPVALDERSSKFDLTFAVTEAPGGEASVAIEYSTDLFDRDRIERMALHFAVLAESVTHEPKQRISAVAIMPPKERRLITEEFSTSRTAYPRDSTIAAEFERQVAEGPERIAVCFEDERLTYKELDDRANAVATLLRRRLQTQPEECVGVLLDRSEHVPVALLGILKAGGAYLPLDPAYPAARLELIMRSAGCRVVLSETNHIRGALSFVEGVESVDVRSVATAPAGGSTTIDRGYTQARSLAYVMYTSGSTGEPKGSLIDQRSVIRLVRNTNYIEFDHTTRVLQTGSLAFDASTFEIWGPLLNGGSVIFASQTALLDAPQLGSLISRHSVTIMWLTAGLFNQLADEDAAIFSGLRHLLVGGEKLSPRHVNMVRERCPGLMISNGYGPTENTTFTACFRIERSYTSDIPIGRPIANTQILLLDEYGEMVPIGVPGELCAGGDGLSRGYLDDPAGTAAAFVPHPFEAGARLYRTGDLARWHPSGAIDYLGRRDSQVKIRGYRIELAEIENRLLAHEAVSKAVVTAMPNGGGGKTLMAYVNGSRLLSPVELRAHLLEALPAYMAPAEYVQVDEFPLTKNGKIDFAALPAPGTTSPSAPATDGPTTAAERVLVEVWESTFGRTGIGIHDNYFELGGDSIQAILIAGRLRRQGWTLSIQDLFHSPTIAELSARLGWNEAAAASDEVSGDVPLTAVQRWFFAEQPEDRHHFNQAILLRSRERIDEPALRAAANALQRHHDMLRATYRFTEHGVTQTIAGLTDVPDPDVSVVDLRQASDERAALAEHVEQAHRNFSLEAGPLFKTVLYRLASGDRLLLVIHHLLVDGVSWRILLEDLERGYAHALEGRAIDLGQKTMSFKDWAEDMMRYVREDRCRSTYPYWKDVASAQEDAAGARDSRYSDVESIAITFSESETSNILTQTHHAYEIEINDLLLTALGRTLKWWTGRSATLVMLEGHGREALDRDVDLGRTVGWFTSLYPVALALTGEDIGEQIKDVKESLRRIPHKGLDYALLRYVADAQQSDGPSLSVRPVVSFNYLGQFDANAESFFTFAGEGNGSGIGPRIRRTAELEISGLVAHGKLSFSFSFSPAQHARGTMEALIARFKVNVLAVTDHCATSDVEDSYPLSPMQSGLLFQSLFDAGRPAYFLQMTLRFLGNLQEECFRQSWQFLAKRHAILRTAFVHEGMARPVQVVLRNREPEISYADIRHLDAAARDAHIESCRQVDLARGFDLQREPLVRLALFRVGDREHHLVWSYHHILLDGWCLGLLQQEFLDAYAALRRGERPVTAPAPQYRDYIRWIEQQDSQRARDYWKGYFAGRDRPSSVPRLPSRFEDGFRQETVSLPESLTAAISALAIRCGVTVNTILQCAWGLLLARSNDVDDVVFGTIVSGRPAELPGVESMVGLFINAVPVRVRLDAAQTVVEWLKSAQRSALESDAFHYLPLAEMQGQRAGDRDLFDHLFVFENYPTGFVSGGGALSGAGFSVESLQVHDRTHYDLDVTVTPGRELVVSFGANSAVFPPDQIARLAAQWRTALQSMVERPDAQIGLIDIVPAGEQQRLRNFNRTTQPYPAHETILSLLVEQVAAHRDDVAVVFGDGQLTYGELDRQSNQLARYLRAHGAARETLVGISLERSLDLIVAVWGVLKAGAGYVPLDPSYPADRLAFMRDDARLQLLVTQEFLDTERDRIAQEHDGGIEAPPDAQQLAYVIYTSGSTGMPKGVMVEHGSLAQAARGWREVYELGKFPVRSLQLASFSFDVFAGDLIRALTNGGQLILCPADVPLDPEALYELLARHQINIFESTPGIVVPLMEHIHDRRLDVGFLRCLIIGSDSLPSAAYRELVNRFGGQMRIVNSYGVTEATIDSSTFELPGPDYAMGPVTPIGRPLPNVRYFILDRAGRFAPIGASGELYVGGTGVARGYLHRADLTGERFMTHPSLPGERLYRTGDLARWLPDGDVEFLGRSDDQVKLRGYRIELGEIENTLLGHPGVSQAVVLTRNDTLVAHAVTAADASELRLYLAQRLPAYMVPARVVLRDVMPLTPNGKVDRAALRDDRLSAEGVATAYEPPRTSLEAKVARVWSEVLQVERVGVHDNFFDLGGHSLKAMQVVSRLHRDLNVKIRLRDLFGGPTIAELVLVLAAAGIDTFSAIPPAPPQAHYDLSHAQKRLWLRHQLGEASAYNMPEAVALEEAPDVQALQKAFASLVERHEALRTAFVTVDGEPRQQVISAIPFDLCQIDLSGEPDADPAAKARLKLDAYRPFDLTSPPLLRAVLLKLSDRRYIFMLVMHHIIGDGWSINLLYRELVSLYDAYRRGGSDPLKPLRIQYKDFTLWQNARGFVREEQYWLEKLARVPDRLELPYDFPAAADVDVQGRIEQATLTAETVEGLRLLAVRKNTSVSSVVLALFKLFLFQLTRQEDLCVGVGIANRNHPDLENLIGFFVNILPIRTRLSPDMEFEALLDQVAGTMHEAFEYQDYPFDLLVEKLNPDRSMNRHPITNVIYGFQNFEDVHIDIGLRNGEDAAAQRIDGEEGLKAFDVGFETSKFDLTLFVTAHGDSLLLSMEYNSGLFRRDTVLGYLSALQRFSEHVALQPSEG